MFRRVEGLTLRLGGSQPAHLLLAPTLKAGRQLPPRSPASSAPDALKDVSQVSRLPLPATLQGSHLGKAQVFPALPASLSSPRSLLLQSIWPPCCSSNVPGPILPQGLCTGGVPCLAHSSISQEAAGPRTCIGLSPLPVLIAPYFRPRSPPQPAPRGTHFMHPEYCWQRATGTRTTQRGKAASRPPEAVSSSRLNSRRPASPLLNRPHLGVSGLVRVKGAPRRPARRAASVHSTCPAGRSRTPLGRHWAQRCLRRWRWAR